MQSTITELTRKKKLRTVNSIEEFSTLIKRERFRADRNNQKFSLITFDVGGQNKNLSHIELLTDILTSRIRICDEVGWFDEQRIAVLLPETAIKGARKLAHCISEKITLAGILLHCTMYMYPSMKWIDGESLSAPSCPVDTVHEKLTVGHRVPIWKRTMDIIGSSIGILIMSPLLIAFTIMIKIVSPGPVFFRQERVGRSGNIFTLFKFRTMSVNNDESEHRKYLKNLIGDGSEDEKPMIKLDDNARIIPFGKIIRSMAIDELPQLINVLRGEMSLVGPRPCIPYEAEEYLRWHARRFDITPGLTGLWQVSGKNKTTFKEMIRLDIKYAAERSFLMDVIIFLKTPLVVLSQFHESMTEMKPGIHTEQSIPINTVEVA